MALLEVNEVAISFGGIQALTGIDLNVAPEEITADGYTAALEDLIQKQQPSLVLFPHTYQVRDFAPKLATRFSRVLVSGFWIARVA